MAEIFRALRIKSRCEFDSCIEHLRHETLRARNHWDFLKAFEKSFNQYAIEVNQTPAFWEFTRRAHQDEAILRLARLYDPDPATISLGTFLQTNNRISDRAIRTNATTSRFRPR